MAALGTNNPFLKLVAAPGDIQVKWPLGTLATDNVQVSVLGFKDQWTPPHNTKVSIKLLYSYLMIILPRAHF